MYKSAVNSLAVLFVLGWASACATDGSPVEGGRGGRELHDGPVDSLTPGAGGSATETETETETGDGAEEEEPQAPADLVMDVPPGWPLDDAYDCGVGSFSHPGNGTATATCMDLESPELGYEGFEPALTIEVGAGDYACSQAGLQAALDDAEGRDTLVLISESCDRIDMSERLRIRGQTILDGQGALFVLEGVVGDGVVVQDASEVVVRNLEIDATGQIHGGSGETDALAVWQSSSILVERLDIYGGDGSGIYIGGHPNDNITARYNAVSDFGRHGIALGLGASGYLVYSNYLDGNAQIYAKGGLNLDTWGEDAEIAGNWMSYSGIRGAKFPALSNSLIHANAFVNNAEDGLFAHSSSKDLVVARNFFAGNGDYGVYVTEAIDGFFPVGLVLEDNVYASGEHANGWAEDGESIGIGFATVTLCGTDAAEYDDGRVAQWSGGTVSECR